MLACFVEKLYIPWHAIKERKPFLRYQRYHAVHMQHAKWMQSQSGILISRTIFLLTQYLTFNSKEKYIYVNFVFRLKVSCKAEIEATVATFFVNAFLTRRLWAKKSCHRPIMPSFSDRNIFYLNRSSHWCLHLRKLLFCPFRFTPVLTGAVRIIYWPQRI